MRLGRAGAILAVGCLSLLLAACGAPGLGRTDSATAGGAPRALLSPMPTLTPTAATTGGGAQATAAPTGARSAEPVLPPLSAAAWPLPGVNYPASTLPGAGNASGSLHLRVPILMYHRIVDPVVARCGIPGLCVPPRTFAAQLGALAAAGWHTITMATLAQDLATGTNPPPRTFVITIDDGYRDAFTNGLPVLKKLGFVATYYVVTGRLGRPLNLRPEDLVSLADAGMEIGDHTVRHVNLARLGGADLAMEIGQAAATIAEIVGRRPATFCYPFGDWSPTVVAAVGAAGFGAAVLNRNSGPEDLANRLLLPRSEVGPSTLPQVLLARVSAY